MLNQDLKEGISLAKRHDYEHALEQTRDLAGLGLIEHQVRIDSRLTQSDRILLLSAVTRVFHIQSAYMPRRLGSSDRRRQ
jgi:hypothetical protein